MKLSDFLRVNDLTESVFAARVGISREMVNRLKNGSVWPSRETAEKVRQATDGAVMPNDFMERRPQERAPEPEDCTPAATSEAGHG